MGRDRQSSAEGAWPNNLKFKLPLLCLTFPLFLCLVDELRSQVQSQTQAFHLLEPALGRDPSVQVPTVATVNLLPKNPTDLYGSCTQCKGTKGAVYPVTIDKEECREKPHPLGVPE